MNTGTETIDPTAKIAEGAALPAFTWVGAYTEIGPQVWVGVKCIIGKRVQIYGDVRLNAGVEIGDDVVLQGPLVIEEGCIIGKGSHIGKIGSSPTTLRKNCRVGCGSIITGGVVLEESVFVKASSRVVANIPAHALVGGAPCAVYGFLCTCGGPLSVVSGNGKTTLQACSRCSERCQISAKAIGMVGRVLLPEGELGAWVPVTFRSKRWSDELNL